MVRPLTRMTRDGKPYRRVEEIETLLEQLVSVSLDELLERSSISNRNDPRYIPSECLVHLIRGTRSDPSIRRFEGLYRNLLRRVLRSVPSPDSADGQTLSLTRARIQEKVVDRLADLLAADRREPSDRLDFFEVRFDAALANLRRDAQEQVWKEQNRYQSLVTDSEPGEFNAVLDSAVGQFDPFGVAEMQGQDYRSRLDAAIDTLPPDQIRIIQMLRRGVPIDSREDGVMTIAKALGRSEKTIRSHRDQAYAAIRAWIALEDGR